MNDRKTIVAGIVLAAVVWWLATAPESPVRPAPPEPKRPVLRFLGKVAVVAAKLGLTTLMFMEPPPHEPDEVHLAHAAVGLDGYQQLRNERW